MYGTYNRKDRVGSTSSGDLLMTIIYPNFKPMANSMAQKLKANDLKRRKILQYHHNVSTDESHRTTWGSLFISVNLIQTHKAFR